MDGVPRGVAPRKRRPYKKSRKGCRNCKLRRVKCDEAKPQCKKCSEYGVLCNFDPHASDLQAWTGGLHSWSTQPSDQLEFHIGPCRSLGLSAVSSDETAALEMDAKSMARLGRFRARTIPALGAKNMIKAWEDVLLHTAFTNPFLMHTLLATTATHDRYMDTQMGRRRTLPEAYHWSKGVVLFNQKLSRPIVARDRDAIWATAALLAILAFSSFDAATPEEAWPLKPPDPSDLEWLTLGEGKKTIWRLTNPLRPGSIFRTMADEYAQLHPSIPDCGAIGISPAVAQLCNLDSLSTAENNPYFGAAHSLARLDRLAEEAITATQALSFLSHLHPCFRNKLRAKDPVALLLLALWYQKAVQAAWWIERRAQMESKAICLYLRRFHGSKSRILDLLPAISTP